MQGKAFAKTLVASALCFQYAQSAIIDEQNIDIVQQQKGVRFGIERGYKVIDSKSKFSKRDDGSNVLKFVIDNQQSYYSVNISVGTPAQNVTALLDTGSSDLWLLGDFNNVTACQAYLNEIGDGSSSSSSSSSSKKDVQNNNVVENDIVYANFHRVLNQYQNKQEQQEQVERAAAVVTTQTVNLESYIATASLPTGFDWDLTSGFSYATESATGTGSGVDSSNSAEASQVLQGCKDSGIYTPEDSSSYKKNDSTAPFLIRYGDLTFASGWWASDSIAINGVEVPLQFAVANVSNSTSVLGISFEELESSVASYSNDDDESSKDLLENFTYPNLPVVLKNEGLIDKISYSLYLNSLEQPYGEILFGAVDSTKYTGQLYTIPLVNIYKSQGLENPVEFDVTLQGSGISTAKGTKKTFSTTKIPALLDSGTTLMYLPTELAEMFADSVDAEWDDDLQSYIMECPSDEDQLANSYAFDLGGFLIYAPLRNFVLTTTDPKTCALGVVPQDQLYAVLGDVFLSSAYVVFDMEDYEVSIAQANYDGASEEANIKAIVSTVPNAIKAPMYSSTWSTTASISTGGNIFTASNATNPWTATNNNGASTISVDASGITKTSSYAGSRSSTKTATKTSNGGSSSSSSSSSSKSKNAAVGITAAFSNEGLFATLFVLFSALF